jgi:hypothetical protein
VGPCISWKRSLVIQVRYELSCFSAVSLDSRSRPAASFKIMATVHRAAMDRSLMELAHFLPHGGPNAGRCFISIAIMS